MENDNEMQALLMQARERGEHTLVGKVVPAGLDKFSVYAGLLQGFVELGKLVVTEERDLQAIQTYHKVEMSRIEAALQQVESAMIVDFQRDENLRASTFESINLLISAGQYDVASEFHKRFMDKLSRPSLQTLVDHRNAIADDTGTKWLRKKL